MDMMNEKGNEMQGNDQDLSQTLFSIFEERQADMDHAVRCLKVMAHPTRLKILCVLRNGEYSVQDIEHYVGVPQTTVSQHLSLLKDRGMVVSRREGNQSIYRIADPGVVKLFELIQEIYCS